jgi:hypothetical protein
MAASDAQQKLATPPVNNTRRAKPVKADKRVEKARQLK